MPEGDYDDDVDEGFDDLDEGFSESATHATNRQRTQPQNSATSASAVSRFRRLLLLFLRFS